MSTRSKVAFFGATGGCAGYCPTATLQSGVFDCIALARTPAKLTSSLKDKGVTLNALSRLHIIQGNVKDVTTVKAALQIDVALVDIIVSGIGGTPIFQWSLFQPVTMTDRRSARTV